MAPVVLSLMLAAAQLTLTPVPKQVEMDKGDGFRLSPVDPIVVTDERLADRDTAVASLRRASGFELPVAVADAQRRGARGIYVGEAGAQEPVKRRAAGSIMNLVGREDAPSLPPGGYSLRVTEDMIAVTGADPEGTFNGVQTLCQLIGDHGEIPCMTIEDAPDLAWRGAWVQGPLPAAQLDAFAALKCNLVAFASDDFLELTSDRAAAWREVFDEARRRHIEPVPVVRTLTNVSPFLKHHPEAAIARVVTEKVRLEEDNWALLSHPNILATPESPIIVSRSTKTFTEGRDYAIDRGDFNYPYEETNAPWLIRRNIGGAIPDGDAVSVTYAYVPEGTADCLPFAEGTKQAWLGMLETVTRELKPRFIAVRHDWPAGTEQDPRAAAAPGTVAAQFAESIRDIDKLARRANTDLRLLVFSDAFQSTRSKIAELATNLPRTAAYVVQAGESDSPGEGLAPWIEANLEVFGMTEPSAGSAYAWGTVMSGSDAPIRGLFASLGSDTAPTAAFKIAMQKSWAADKWRSPWPEALNAYFDADLWEPEYGEVLGAVAAHVDRRTLGGVEPEDTQGAFREYLNRMGSRLDEDDPQVKLVSELVANMTEYLELERAFTREPGSSPLRKLVDVVERQTALDPRADKDRTARIVETIERKGLFVPSSILFGIYLLPFREMPVITGHRPVEIVAEPDYTDSEHTVQATYDFLAEPGPICRVDFDTVGAASVLLEKSRDGKDFSPIQKWTSGERGGFRAPAILDKPVSTRYLRVTIEAPAERAVLRNPRVFALKGPAVGVCGRTDAPPVLDASFKEKCWPVEPQVDGFIRADGRIFAAAQTTFWLCADRDTLYVAVYAREPRMATMAAEETVRDASLDNDEHITITLQIPKGPAFTLAVNPSGTQFDSRNGDAAWNGDWKVVTASYDEGWAAEFAIPFKNFGAQPKRSEAWPVNFIRFRNNVHKESSSWAYDPETDRFVEWGNMIFN